MPSASELVRQQKAKEAAETAARDAAKRKTEAEKLASAQTANQRRQNEHKKRMQQSKEAADRVLRESGVLEEVKAIKRDHIDGKFSRSTLFINYGESEATLHLVWGEYFSITEEKDGKKVVGSQKRASFGSFWGLFGSDNVKDYYSLFVSVDMLNESINIKGDVLDKPGWQANKQKLSNSLSQAFLSAPRTAGDYTSEGELLDGNEGGEFGGPRSGPCGHP